MHVGVWGNAFFLFRRLLRGTEVVLACSIWRVRDSSLIDMYKDNWLPSLPGFKVQFDGDEQVIPCMEFSLISNDFSLNFGLIDKLFEVDVAVSILSIHINENNKSIRLI